MFRSLSTQSILNKISPVMSYDTGLYYSTDLYLPANVDNIHLLNDNGSLYLWLTPKIYTKV